MASTKAVVPRLMTIAVRTSAWGSGSLIPAGSPVPTIGARPAGPLEIRNSTLTPLPSMTQADHDPGEAALQDQVDPAADHRRGGEDQRQARSHVVTSWLRGTVRLLAEDVPVDPGAQAAQQVEYQSDHQHVDARRRRTAR